MGAAQQANVGVARDTAAGSATQPDAAMVEGVMAVQNPVVQHDGGQGDDDATMTDGMLHGQKRRRKEVVQQQQ